MQHVLGLDHVVILVRDLPALQPGRGGSVLSGRLERIVSRHEKETGSPDTADEAYRPQVLDA